MKKDEYIIINKTDFQKRIEELESKIIPNPNFDSEIDSHNLLFIAKQNELNKILSQSTPLIPELDKAYEAGKLDAELGQTFDNPKGRYFSNLKLDI